VARIALLVLDERIPAILLKSRRLLCDVASARKKAEPLSEFSLFC